MPATPRRKPKKPSRSYPLTAHPNGQWCKKILGKIHFFGVWNDADAALKHYLAVATDLHAGREPRPSTVAGEGPLVKDVCNAYLTRQLRRFESGEITPRWFTDCRSVVEHFGKKMGPMRLANDLRPQDFTRYRRILQKSGLGAGKNGVHALSRNITIVKSAFKYAWDNEVIEKPMRFGSDFSAPSASAKRKSRRTSVEAYGKRLLQPEQILALMNEASVPLRAMIFLGINGGFGNTDCARLKKQVLDFDEAVIDSPRTKTGIDRVVPLWPETVNAIAAAIQQRPAARQEEYDNHVFLTRQGQPWVRERIHEENGAVTKIVPLDALGQAFSKLLCKLEIKRKGLSFYALRHSFRTWADECNDQHAIHRIMGHEIPGMAGLYVEEINLKRLRAVTDHVRSRLFE